MEGKIGLSFGAVSASEIGGQSTRISGLLLDAEAKGETISAGTSSVRRPVRRES